MLTTEQLDNFYSANRNRNFKDNIIHYNAASAFASRSANIDPLPQHGHYCMRISGQIYHNLGNLQPQIEPVQRQYAQLYMLDSEIAVQQRMGHHLNVNCRQDIFQLIDNQGATIPSIMFIEGCINWYNNKLMMEYPWQTYQYIYIMQEMRIQDDIMNP
jgi:hypothetical protein